MAPAAPRRYFRPPNRRPPVAGTLAYFRSVPMIQRIQTVFLILIVLAMAGVLLLPLWSKTDPATGERLTLTAFQLTSVRGQATAANGAITASQHEPVGTWPIGLLAAAAGAVALYEIFQYRNRLTQLKLGLFNSLLLAGTLGALVYYIVYVAEPMINSGAQGEKMSGFYLPFLGLMLNVLANKFIKRDEDLVRSADRLR